MLEALASHRPEGRCRGKEDAQAWGWQSRDDYCRPGASGVVSLARLKEDPSIECAIKTILLHLKESDLGEFEDQFSQV